MSLTSKGCEKQTLTFLRGVANTMVLNFNHNFVSFFAKMNSCNQGWKPGYLALGCQFRCVETQMSGFSFGLVSRLLKNRLQFRFQFCLRAASVSGFQFRFKFHPRKLFYWKYELFKSSTSWIFVLLQ